MVMRVRKAGMAMRGAFQSTELMPPSMRAPTRMRAGAVAKSGMAPTMGAMKMASRKSRPVVMAVTPVRPPAATPAEDSM